MFSSWCTIQSSIYWGFSQPCSMKPEGKGRTKLRYQSCQGQIQAVTLQVFDCPAILSFYTNWFLKFRLSIHLHDANMIWYYFNAILETEASIWVNYTISLTWICSENSPYSNRHLWVSVVGWGRSKLSRSIHLILDSKPRQKSLMAEAHPFGSSTHPFPGLRHWDTEKCLPWIPLVTCGKYM